MVLAPRAMDVMPRLDFAAEHCDITEHCNIITDGTWISATTLIRFYIGRYSRSSYRHHQQYSQITPPFQHNHNHIHISIHLRSHLYNNHTSTHNHLIPHDAGPPPPRPTPSLSGPASLSSSPSSAQVERAVEVYASPLTDTTTMGHINQYTHTPHNITTCRKRSWAH
jgi:hypothetical protein